MELQSQQDWVRQAKAGDTKAFGRLVGAYQDMVVSYAASVLGDLQLAEDASQEAFVSAYIHLNQLKEAKAFGQWVRQIAHQKCLQFLRKDRRKSESNRSLDRLPSKFPDPDRDVLSKDLAEKLTGLIHALPEQERAITFLCYVSGRSQSDVGGFLDLPVSTIKNRLRSARASLKEEILSLMEETMHESRPSRNTLFIDAVLGAVESNRPEKVARQIETSPEVLAQTGSDLVGRTPLHLAAQRGHQEIVDLLIQEGAEVNSRNEEDKAMPLHFAAEEGHLNIVKVLVKHGAALNDEDNIHEGSPLRWATAFGKVHRHVAEFLLSCGANHDIFSAAALGDTKALRKLIKGNRGLLEAKMSRFEYYQQPLHLSVQLNARRSAYALIELGADPNALNWWGFSPCALSRLYNSAVSVLPFTKMGAIDDFSLAVVGEDRDHSLEFIQAFPGLLMTRPHCRLLHYFALNGHAKIVQFLLQLGADPNLQLDMHGIGATNVAPLHAAAANGHSKVIEALLEWNADQSIIDTTWGATPLKWAEYNGHGRAAQLLKGI